MTRPRLLAAASALAIVAAACNPTPSASPPESTGSPPPAAPTASPAESLAAVGSPPPCPGVLRSVPFTRWWQTAVFYEVFVRSYADSNGDGIGDFDGLREHLDDIQRLGANALWLMPVAKSPSYHGYDVTDYTAVERDYGSLESFKSLIAEAHRRNMFVVIDFEANHTSIDHPWFQDALDGGKHHDWYVWSKDDPGWPNPIGAGNPWRSSKAGYYYALFWEGMPDLNLRNPAATKALEKAASFWQALGVDGFRIDAARHLIEDGPDQQVNTPETHAWLQAFSADVHANDDIATNKHTLVVGEVADAERVSGGYVSDSSLDMAFDFEIGPAIANAVSHGDAASLLISEAGIGKAYADGGAGTFLSNHDQPRIMTQLRGDMTAAKLSAETLLTAPGTPFIYYGEELGMTGPKPDEQIRTPYPWTASGPGYGFTTGTPWEPFGDGAATANHATEAADPNSLLSTYTNLVALRKWSWFATAPFIALDSSNPKIAASLRVQQRGYPGMLVVQNLATDDAANVSLTLKGVGPLCETPTATLVYPRTMAGTTVAAPAVTSTGGLDGYVPLPTIPARSTIVIAFNWGPNPIP
ncbi:MAG TPA: alpha-amylase family glycosyl hydrolase [Candidatus Limnocylindrales bacterium]|nr:alpha-amylase family glycosyl hydrolase [Candidatus Limnocylindrales bacterium]